MGLDEELESMEEVGETDAEWTDQETELEDAEDDEDALFDADEEDAAESDLEHAYDSFMTCLLYTSPDQRAGIQLVGLSSHRRGCLRGRGSPALSVARCAGRQGFPAAR